jgi:DNA-binding response OmpR family regulator
MMAQVDYDMDMLVSDLVLPKLSGREVAARMLEHNPDAKVVFMTGYDDQLDTFYALPNDAIILEKPFPLNTLLVKVRELLDQGKKK